MVGGKSVMDGPDVCDEKGQGLDCGSEDARGSSRLERRETWGTRRFRHAEVVGVIAMFRQRLF